MNDNAIHPKAPRKLKKNGKLKRKFYEEEVSKLQIELAKLQSWIKATEQRIVIIFEGRDAAGKGGTIKRITEPLNPHIARVITLRTPTKQKKTQ